MKSKEYPKYFVAVGCFVAAIVVCLLVIYHRDFSGKNVVFDNLYEGLKIPQQTERNAIEFAKYGPAGGNYLLNRLAKEKSDYLREVVVQAIELSGCESCAEKLVSYTKDSNLHVRVYTISTLCTLKYEKLSPLLQSIIMTDSDERVKAVAILALGKYGTKKDLPFLTELESRQDFQTEKLRKSLSVAAAKLKDHVIESKAEKAKVAAHDKEHLSQISDHCKTFGIEYLR